MNAAIITFIHILAFLGIGSYGALFIARRKWVPDLYFLITAIGVSSFFAYILFFIYAWQPGVGSAVSGLYYLFGLIGLSLVIIKASRHKATKRLLLTYCVPPLILMFTVITLYSALLFSCQDKRAVKDEAFNPYQACLLNQSTSDNVLPLIFGDNIIQNRDSAIVGDWKLADRPPLQIGATISLLDIIESNSTKLVAYQVFSMFIQLSWIAALWALLKHLRLSVFSEGAVLILSFFSGFYFYNSIYVWPKLYAAAFVLAAIGLLFYDSATNKKTSMQSYTISALIFLSLGLLAHGGIIFTLIPLAGMVLLIKKYNPGLRPLLIGTIIASLVYAPWVIYKAQNLTSDRLVKWHFAGMIAVNDTSTSQAIINSYSNLSLKDWTSARIKNAEHLFIPNGSVNAGHLIHDNQSKVGNIRNAEFEATIPALGLLNIGWFIIGWLYIRRKQHSNILIQQPLIALSILSLVTWILLMFIPGSTLIHQGSFATMALLFTSSITAISLLPRMLALLIFSFQILYFYLIWILYAYHQNSRSIIVATGIFFVSIITMFYVSRFSNKLYLTYRKSSSQT